MKQMRRAGERETGKGETGEREMGGDGGEREAGRRERKLNEDLLPKRWSLKLFIQKRDPEHTRN